MNKKTIIGLSIAGAVAICATVIFVVKAISSDDDLGYSDY